jgi:hypothetical protein
MSAVIARHPSTTQWVSFERRNTIWEPHSVSVGTLEPTILGALPGLTGTFSFSERCAEQVRAMLAHEPSDLRHPALANVSMTVFLPMTQADPTLWGQLHVIRGNITYAGSSSHFRVANLGSAIVEFFTRIGWKDFEAKVRPEWPRELLVRPRWLASALVPSIAVTAEQMAKRAHLAEVERAYEAKRKENTPWARRARQWEIDQAALKGTQAERSAADDARKRQFGFPPAAKIDPVPPPKIETENYEAVPGGGWIRTEPKAQGE